jgi:dTDP-glucose pyrophosphorylase
MFIESTAGNKTTLKPFTTLTVGDKLIVRLEIKIDRPMEYIHLKDLRAAGLEPINVISQYKYQGGLGYYESTKDLSTNFSLIISQQAPTYWSIR